jgi:hypothetical protein
LSTHRQPAESTVGDLPGPGSAGPGPATLPVPRIAFIGRGSELARAADLLSGARLLTLLGPGGYGKTRLAVWLAADHPDLFPGGTYFVDLSPLLFGTQVIGQVAQSVGVEEPERESALSAAVCRGLGIRPTLVVLDNCEHVVDATAGVVGDLLSGSPGLTILATSPERLAVDGELTWTLPAMMTTRWHSSSIGPRRFVRIDHSAREMRKQPMPSAGSLIDFP